MPVGRPKLTLSEEEKNELKKQRARKYQEGRAQFARLYGMRDEKLKCIKTLLILLYGEEIDEGTNDEKVINDIIGTIKYCYGE
jgi:hypothetical protein